MDKQKLEARREAKREAAELAIIEQQKNQKPINKIIISIEWKKSQMWGSNPHCEVKIYYKDGEFTRSQVYTASGCGYDKESTVIAQVFNDYLRYKLWKLSEEAIKGGHGSGDEGSAPYGINRYSNSRSFAGGIGTNCYFKISEYIGGEFEQTASGKTFDVFTYKDKENN